MGIFVNGKRCLNMVTTTIEKQFLDSISDLKEHLYKEDLYSEGLVMINYDRTDNKFHICEQSDKRSISMDEYPCRDNDYYPEQKRILEIDIESLKEAYNDSLRENDIDEDIDAKDDYYLWESICDNTVEIALEQQLGAEIDDIINEFVNKDEDI